MNSTGKITEKIFMNLLSCEYKAFLSLNDNKLSEYEETENEKRDIHRGHAIKREVWEVWGRVT